MDKNFQQSMSLTDLAELDKVSFEDSDDTFCDPSVISRYERDAPLDEGDSFNRVIHSDPAGSPYLVIEPICLNLHSLVLLGSCEHS